MNAYKQAFDKIEPDEQKRQEFFNKALQHKNTLQANSELKPKKHFLWNARRRIAVASTAAFLLFCAVLIPIITINNGDNPNNSSNKGLEWGFSTDGGSFDPSYQFYSAYKTEKSRYTLGEDVSLALYYGSRYSVSDYERVDYAGNPVSLWEQWHPTIDNPDEMLIEHRTILYYSNNPPNAPHLNTFDCTYCTVYKVIDEDYFEEEYRIRQTNDGNPLTYRFPFFEEITLPKEVFAGIQGRVFIGFQTIGLLQDGSMLNDGAALFGHGGWIYYRVQGEELLISDTDRQLWNVGLSATFTETLKTPDGSISKATSLSPTVLNFTWSGIKYGRIDPVEFAANCSPHKLDISGVYTYSLQVQKMSTVSDYYFRKVTVYTLSLDGSGKKTVGTYRNTFSISLEVNKIYLFVAEYKGGTVESILVTSD